MNKTQNNRIRRVESWFRQQLRQRPKPIWLVIAADVLLIAIALLVFALFHHVLPRHEASLGVVSNRESAGETQAFIGDTEDYEDGDGGDESEDMRVSLSELSGDDLSFSEDDSADSSASQAEDPEPADSGAAEATPSDDETSSAEITEDGEAEAAEFGTEALAAVGDFASDVPGFFGDKFADKFTTGKVIKSKSGYQSKNLNISLKRYKSEEATFYVADIYIRDISCLVTAFARNRFGKGVRDWARTITRNIGGVVAINGDYYGGRSDGIVIRNGELYRSDRYPNRDVCVLFWDGRMETYGPGKFDAQAAIDAGAYQAWNFGPRLLDNEGKAKTSFNSDVGPTNPRTALGYFEPGHYCFVVVDGRQKNSKGMKLRELSLLMRDLGCVRAYNMDGGNTSVMVAGDKVVNNPSSGGRMTTDIIAIVDK